MRKILRLIFVFVLSSSQVLAQKSKPLTDSELAEITARGRMLAAYDAASWHATDAVLALKPAKEAVARYIARKTDAGWVVAFGKFNEAKDALLVAYEATQGRDTREFHGENFRPTTNGHWVLLCCCESD